eukprot:7385879-Prymnesium_polylepis.2
MIFEPSTTAPAAYASDGEEDHEATIQPQLEGAVDPPPQVESEAGSPPQPEGKPDPPPQLEGEANPPPQPE